MPVPSHRFTPFDDYHFSRRLLPQRASTTVVTVDPSVSTDACSRSSGRTAQAPRNGAPRSIVTFCRWRLKLSRRTTIPVPSSEAFEPTTMSAPSVTRKTAPLVGAIGFRSRNTSGGVLTSAEKRAAFSTSRWPAMLVRL